MSAAKILFIDRDGTLIKEPADFQIDSLEKLELVEGVIPALLELKGLGYRFVMVTNQDGLGTPKYPQASFDLVQKQMLGLFSSQGIHFDEILICPHFPKDGCTCRKPHLGLVRDYLDPQRMQRELSFVIGDRQTDLELARNMGIQGFRLGSWAEFLAIIRNSKRRATEIRRTKETQISVTVNLDETLEPRIKTGLGFFDHMLEQLGKHGGFTLAVEATGDLHIDEHHLVEDTALALGKALKTALGDKFGIQRYGFSLPMDEARAEALLDLGGRPYLVFAADFPASQVGQMSVEMVPHFFRSLAESLGANLQITASGENTHHIVEGIFKAVARALRMAIRQEKGAGASLPSTKGAL